MGGAAQLGQQPAWAANRSPVCSTVAVKAEQLEVGERVDAPVGDWLAVVYLEPVG
jgi:hypothetical protein